ncbi:uncharacterized protein LOC127835649 [Dreissena polymorpha]|uniref:uncharacterized protein LOC127835649 n=1 Tax=Dreissena polymorpha TaxID=45954 RepID=UPI002264DA78|nr:uncharacterized protein LOC127835649 [Dreissena polymorpha]
MSMKQIFQSTQHSHSLEKCPPYAKVPNGKILGNLHCDGTKRLLKCDNGYAPKDRTYVQSVCKDRQRTNITQCVPEKCVHNQDTFKSSTYTFAIDSRRNYTDSVAFCQYCGYRVVTIESEDEQSFLANKMSRFVPYPQPYTSGDNDGFLLDFYNTGHSVLRMDDNTHISYSNFRANEPSNGTEPKIAAMGTDNWLWHDVPEQDRFQTVCESDI